MITSRIYFLGAILLGLAYPFGERWFGNPLWFAAALAYVLVLRHLATRYGRRRITPRWKIDRAVRIARENQRKNRRGADRTVE